MSHGGKRSLSASTPAQSLHLWLDPNRRGARVRPPDAARCWISSRLDRSQDYFRTLRGAGDQKTSRSVRVGQQVALPISEIGWQLDAIAIARPVAPGCAGHEPIANERNCCPNNGEIAGCRRSRSSHPESRAILQDVSQQTESGHMVMAWTVRYRKKGLVSATLVEAQRAACRRRRRRTRRSSRRASRCAPFWAR